MTKDEFMSLVHDFVDGHMLGKNWCYKCHEMKAEKNKQTGQSEIKIVYTPYKIEHTVPSYAEQLGR